MLFAAQTGEAVVVREGQTIILVAQEGVNDIAMKDAEVPSGHPCAETRDLHPTDRMLRNHGFRIYSRPQQANEDTIWMRDGIAYHQVDALALARGEQKEIALAQKEKK